MGEMVNQMSKNLVKNQQRKCRNSLKINLRKQPYHIEMMPVSKKKENIAHSLFNMKNLGLLLKIEQFIKSESKNDNEDSFDVTKISNSGSLSNINH